MKKKKTTKESRKQKKKKKKKTQIKKVITLDLKMRVIPAGWLPTAAHTIFICRKYEQKHWPIHCSTQPLSINANDNIMT